MSSHDVERLDSRIFLKTIYPWVSSTCFVQVTVSDEKRTIGTCQVLHTLDDETDRERHEDELSAPRVQIFDKKARHGSGMRHDETHFSALLVVSTYGDCFRVLVPHWEVGPSWLFVLFDFWGFRLQIHGAFDG